MKVYMGKKSVANRNFIFFNKNKNEFIHVDLHISINGTQLVISKSTDGINLQFPTEREHVIDTLPPFIGNAEYDSIQIRSHFITHGFKAVKKNIRKL